MSRSARNGKKECCKCRVSPVSQDCRHCHNYFCAKHYGKHSICPAKEQFYDDIVQQAQPSKKIKTNHGDHSTTSRAQDSESTSTKRIRADESAEEPQPKVARSDGNMSDENHTSVSSTFIDTAANPSIVVMNDQNKRSTDDLAAERALANDTTVGDAEHSAAIIDSAPSPNKNEANTQLAVQAEDNDITDADVDPFETANLATLIVLRAKEDGALTAINNHLIDGAKRFTKRAKVLLEITKAGHQQHCQKFGPLMVKNAHTAATVHRRFIELHQRFIYSTMQSTKLFNL